MGENSRMQLSLPGISVRKRTYFRELASLSILLTLGLAGCASTPQYDSRVPNETHAKKNKSSNSHVRAGEEKETYGSAIASPLEDLNLKKKPIPSVLIKALENPYDLQHLERCEQIAAEVGKLDEVLGYDYDEPPMPVDDQTLTEKGGEMANDYAVGAVKGAARSIIPFRGFVRQLSGADSYAKMVNNSIQAGRARRAYLKGIGMNKNCAPPAAPSWYRPKIYVQTVPAQVVPDSTAKAKTTPKSRRSSRKH